MTSEGQQALDLLRRIAEALERAHPKDQEKVPEYILTQAQENRQMRELLAEAHRAKAVPAKEQK